MAEPDHAAGRRPSLPGWGRLVTLRLVILTSLLFTGAFVGCDGGLADTDWPVYLGSGSSQYSRLGQITRENVAQLNVAWTYHSGDADVDTNRSQMQTSPIVVDGVLYGVSPVTKIFALDAATGARLWEFDPFAAGAEVRGGGTSRGVTYWADGDDRRIFATGGSKLFALDAGTGAPIESFGRGGVVDLHDGLDAGRDVSDLFVISNTPGVIYRDLLILPTRHAETDPAAPGNIRAFDVRTGEVAWVFHTIPHPGELGYDTWPPDAWQRSAPRTTGPACRSTSRAGWSSCRPGRRRPTSTAATGTARTCSRTRCWRSTPPAANAAGTSRRCITTSGTATSPPRPTC